MHETIVSVAGTLLGTLFGAGLTFLIDIWRNKKEKERVTLELKINTYADAIRYISLYAEKETLDDKYLKQLALNEEKALYNRFHPIFTIIAPREKVNEFNVLRGNIVPQKISQEEAYKQVVKLLDFNIND